MEKERGKNSQAIQSHRDQEIYTHRLCRTKKYLVLPVQARQSSHRDVPALAVFLDRNLLTIGQRWEARSGGADTALLSVPETCATEVPQKEKTGEAKRHPGLMRSTPSSTVTVLS